jgi:hypothetical protein
MNAGSRHVSHDKPVEKDHDYHMEIRLNYALIGRLRHRSPKFRRENPTSSPDALCDWRVGVGVCMILIDWRYGFRLLFPNHWSIDVTDICAKNKSLRRKQVKNLCNLSLLSTFHEFCSFVSFARIFLKQEFRKTITSVIKVTCCM